MMNEGLIELTQRAQSGEKQAMADLLERFSPLIRKYANYLDGDDTAQDLRLLLICAIHKLKIENLQSKCDPVFIKYFHQVLYRGYITLSKKQTKDSRNIVAFLDLPEHMLPRVEYTTSTNDSYFEDQYSVIKKHLTDLEFKIIVRVVLLDEKASDIAAELKISRQAISRTKARALKKLRASEYAAVQGGCVELTAASDTRQKHTAPCPDQY